jgi:iron(III) transport system ATP-binding protein
VVRILRTAGATAILVTHDQDEALSMSDQVAVIRDGVIAQLDTPHGIYTRPVDPDLARFVGDVNLLDGTVDGDCVITRLGPLALAAPGAGRPRGPVVVMVRPEQLLLSDDASTTGTTGTVVHQEFYGHDAIVRLTVDDLSLIARVRGGTTWAAGSAVQLTVDGPVVDFPR